MSAVRKKNSVELRREFAPCRLYRNGGRKRRYIVTGTVASRETAPGARRCAPARYPRASTLAPRRPTPFLLLVDRPVGLMAQFMSRQHFRCLGPARANELKIWHVMSGPRRWRAAMDRRVGRASDRAVPGNARPDAKTAQAGTLPILRRWPRVKRRLVGRLSVACRSNGGGTRRARPNRRGGRPSRRRS